MTHVLLVLFLASGGEVTTTSRPVKDMEACHSAGNTAVTVGKASSYRCLRGKSAGEA